MKCGIPHLSHCHGARVRARNYVLSEYIFECRNGFSKYPYGIGVLKSTGFEHNVTRTKL